MPSLQTKAALFASSKHTGQFYGRNPYTFHLTKVVEVLERYDVTDERIIAAGWCHDIIEDTDCSFNDLRKAIGKDSAEIVYAVTDELGRNRKERAKKTHPKIKGNLAATLVKLADRIANVENGNIEGGRMFTMYKCEYQEFKEHIQSDVFGQGIEVIDESHHLDCLEDMWKHLDKLLKIRKS